MKAALAEELAARTAELLERNSEFDERIEHQAATLDVLKAMSASPGDPQPVFELIVERARAFCDADQANLALLDGDMLQLQARSGSSATTRLNFHAGGRDEHVRTGDHCARRGADARRAR